LAGLLTGKGSTGVHTQIAYDPAYPRQLLVGRVKTGGSLAFQGTHSDSNKILEYVIALADHECDGLEQIYVDGQLVTLGALDPSKGYEITTSIDPVTLA